MAGNIELRVYRNCGRCNAEDEYAGTDCQCPACNGTGKRYTGDKVQIPSGLINKMVTEMVIKKIVEMKDELSDPRPGFYDRLKAHGQKLRMRL